MFTILCSCLNSFIYFPILVNSVINNPFFLLELLIFFNFFHSLSQITFVKHITTVKDISSIALICVILRLLSNCCNFDNTHDTLIFFFILAIITCRFCFEVYQKFYLVNHCEFYEKIVYVS